MTNDIEPSTDRGIRRAYTRENKILRAKVVQLEAEVEHYKEQVLKLTSDSIPQLVKNWMTEYRLPWQLFWCYEHDDWFTELDTSFPYEVGQSTCTHCK